MRTVSGVTEPAASRGRPKAAPRASRVVTRRDVVTRGVAARLLGVHPDTITYRVLAGMLGAERIGPHLFPFRSEVEALARAQLERRTQERFGDPAQDVA